MGWTGWCWGPGGKSDPVSIHVTVSISGLIILKRAHCWIILGGGNEKV